jgi:rSAM/selenodomain-associated transferase 1
MNIDLVIVFCKNSIIGKVKTRLAKSIGKSKALKTHNILLDKTFSVLKLLDYDIAIFYSDFIPKHINWTFSKYNNIQNGNSLGDRMKEAFRWGFKMGYKNICIIGSDLWSIEKKIFNEVFYALKNNDIVFGPSTDGGYYLLALKKKRDAIFEINSWGTDKVLKDTLRKIDLNDTIFYLPELNDIDTIEDLSKHNDLKSLIEI